MNEARVQRDEAVTALLQRTRQRLSDPGRWMQYAFAVNAAGYAVGPESPSAVRWCAVGALQKEGAALGGASHGVVREGYQRLAAALPGAPGAGKWADRQHVESFNDQAEHGDVLAMFDEAIRRK